MMHGQKNIENSGWSAAFCAESLVLQFVIQ